MVKINIIKERAATSVNQRNSRGQEFNGAGAAEVPKYCLNDKEKKRVMPTMSNDSAMVKRLNMPNLLYSNDRFFHEIVNAMEINTPNIMISERNRFAIAKPNMKKVRKTNKRELEFRRTMRYDKKMAIVIN